MGKAKLFLSFPALLKRKLGNGNGNVYGMESTAILS